MLEELVREYTYFMTHRRKYSTRYWRHIEKLKRQFPPIPRFEWYDGGVRYTAGMSIMETEEEVVFEFVFTRNGKPCTFQAILNSRKRLAAKEELANMRSVC